MRRVLTSLLAASVLLLAGTFAGIAVFGMGTTASQAAAGCEGHGCHGTPEPVQASGMDCVEHCLASIPASAFAVSASVAATVFILLTIVPILDRIARVARRASVHASDGIGKLLLRRKLASVIMRD